MSPAAAVLLSLLVGGVITGLTELIKKTGVSVSPLVVAAGLSVLGGAIYAVLVATNLWQAFLAHSTVMFAGAVALFEVLSKSAEKIKTL